MSLFTELRQELENYLDTESIEKIYQAYRFAAQAHKGQQRKSGDPYITHPLAVAKILGSMRMDPPTITAAILHDVIEDTPIEKSELIREFGEEVTKLVDGVSKLTQIQFRSRIEAQAENFRKMLLAMADDIRVILIKLADRLHNMRTLDAMPPEKRQRIAHETLEIYTPIADRLGMHTLHRELEELGFATLYPIRFQILQEAVRKAKRSRRSTINKIETHIKETLEKKQFPPCVVWGHTKSLYSIYKDMKEKHLSFDEIIDRFSFCIVVDTIDTCYRTLGVIHSLYKPVPERFHDYIALPKPNGYQALHTVLFGPHGMPVSVQIRTVEMDNIAGSGIASEWLFAENTSVPAHERASEWLKGLLDIQKNTTENPIEFIENVKTDLFREEIYLFTPQGDILALPKGATPVDFAYAIHSDVGNTCIEAKIDRKPVPLNSPLVTGQTIEIITAEDAKPSATWLNFIVTGKARSNIRHFLKAQHQYEAISFGQHLLEAALKTLDKSWEEIPEKNIIALQQRFHYKTKEDLFEAIGLGDQIAPVIAQLLVHKKETQKNSPLRPLSLSIKSSDNPLLRFAECCQPIPGDPILGVVGNNKGIIIHVTDCKELTRMRLHLENSVAVSWDKEVEGFYKVGIQVTAVNQPGVLAQMATAIANTKANIDNVSVKEQDHQYCQVDLTISVLNRDHLAKVMRRLRIIKSITNIERNKE